MTQLPSYLGKFINKAVTSLIFPDDDELNLTAFDMGEDAASISIDGEAVKELPVNFGTVGAAEMAVSATINVSIVKVVAKAEIWKKRFLTNCIIGGTEKTVVFTDDTGHSFNFCASYISTIGEITGNATDPAYKFVLKGTLPVNTDLYGTVIG